MSYLAEISLVGHFPSRAEKRGCENSWYEVPEIGEGIAHPHGGGPSSHNPGFLWLDFIENQTLYLFN
jgi:hypothetical protein